MFLFKKLVAPLFFPIPIILILLIVGLVQMYRSRRSPDGRKGQFWVLSAVVLLVIFGFRPVPSAMVSSLERQYEPLISPPDTNIAWVVVLSGGSSDDPNLGDSHRLSNSTTSRLVEGIRLWKQLPRGRLVLSGGSPFSSLAAAPMMRNVAIELGAVDSAIVVEQSSLDTKDQAVAIGAIVGQETFILVTSATHMPRSMALFRKQGLQPIAAPAEILESRHTRLHPGAFFPSSLNMSRARLAWREYLGLLWASLRGQI
jgi:uncharacterized SAM-binding protein YcdF (DUF218 family)